MDLSPDRNLLAAVGGPANPDLKIWNVQTGERYQIPKQTEDQLPPGATALTVHPNGQMLLVSGGDDVKFLDLTNFQVVNSFQVNARRGLLFSPDRRLLAGVDSQSITLLDAGTGAVLASLNNGSDNFYGSISFSPDSKLIATPSDGNQVLLWRQMPPP
jgi:WD40 repeat protein